MIKVLFGYDGLYRVFRARREVFKSTDWNAVKEFAGSLGWDKECCDN
jgi:hypothetical protein